MNSLNSQIKWHESGFLTDDELLKNLVTRKIAIQKTSLNTVRKAESAEIETTSKEIFNQYGDDPTPVNIGLFKNITVVYFGDEMEGYIVK